MAMERVIRVLEALRANGKSKMAAEIAAIQDEEARVRHEAFQADRKEFRARLREKMQRSGSSVNTRMKKEAIR